MSEDNAVERFHRLSRQYDAKHGRGAALQLKDELSLGSGPFNDELTPAELHRLNEELDDQLASSTA